MQPEVVLTFNEADGTRREVAVDARRFTIGRGGDNNLVIDAPGVSRRHVVIETYDGGVLAYDCQSERGTTLNHAPLSAAAQLRGGDLLTLGGELDITVRLGGRDGHALRAVPPAPAPTAADAGRGRRRDAAPARNAPTRRAAPAHDARHGGRKLSPQGALAAVAVVACVVILSGVALLLAGGRSRETAMDDGREERAAASVTPEPTPPGEAAGASGAAGDVAAAGDKEFEQTAGYVVQRLSGDYTPYPFTDDALEAIRRRVEEYKNSAALGEGITALQREGQTLARAARAEGVEPDLVIFAALARGGGRDAPALARQMTPQLAQLCVTFGSEDANSSLLALAAYTEGVGSKKSHPLLATVRRLASRNSFAERNVWSLRARGGLSDAAYDFVIRTLAVGIVSQDPPRYGVRAPRLVY